MTVSELDETVRELYLVPPSDFVAIRNELVRQARASGNRQLAESLQGLRRPTRSAWLVNLLAHHEPAAMKRLAALGRKLRDAQTGLDGGELRHLAELRKQLIGDLLDRARQHAASAGLRVTDSMLSEVEATLHAALVDLAGSFTIRGGRLVRPMSHNGFGPRPHVDPPPVGPAPVAQAAGEEPAEAEWIYLPVEDELAARRNRGLEELGDVPRLVRPAPTHESDSVVAETEPGQAVRRATADLAAAESAHWQREHDLADAEAALEAAADRLDWLESQRLEARREKVIAQGRVAEAQAHQREAVRTLADARRQLEIARQQALED
jgi:hypothetical protein